MFYLIIKLPQKETNKRVDWVLAIKISLVDYELTHYIGKLFSADIFQGNAGEALPAGFEETATRGAAAGICREIL